MSSFRLAISLAALCTASVSSNAQEGANVIYPPVDQPFYLECAMQGYEEKLPVAKWPKLALYFSDGIDSGFPNLDIVDPQNQLEGGKFGFSIRSTQHWSLIDSEKVPSSDEVDQLPQLLIGPPIGPADFRIMYFKGDDIVRAGVCFGMIGPNTADAFAAAKADPSSLD